MSSRSTSATKVRHPRYQLRDLNFHTDLTFQGKEVDHAFAKEMLAGFAGAGVDYLAETKGEDFYDKEKAKHEAKKKAEQLYDQQYGGQPNYNPNDTEPPKHLKQQFGDHHYKKGGRRD